jgi:hypothetical protein
VVFNNLKKVWKNRFETFSERRSDDVTAIALSFLRPSSLARIIFTEATPKSIAMIYARANGYFQRNRERAGSKLSNIFPGLDSSLHENRPV